jgi:hypothetical protein
MFFNSAPNARNTIKQCARKKEEQRELIPNYKAEKQRKRGVLSSKGARSAIASLIISGRGNKRMPIVSEKKKREPLLSPQYP